VDDTLKRLLDAEQRAQAVVAKAMADRDRLIDQAVEDVKAADERFRARIPELREGFQHKADERAEQAIAEIRRRYGERRSLLDKESERRRQQAAARALEALLGAETD